MTSVDDFDAGLHYQELPAQRLQLSRSGSSLAVASGFVVLTGAAAATTMALGADLPLASVLTAIFGFGAAFIGGLVSRSVHLRTVAANNVRLSITFADSLTRLEAKKRLFREVGEVETALLRVVKLHLGEAGPAIRSADLVKHLYELHIMSNEQITQWHEVLAVRAGMLDFSAQPVPEGELLEACNKTRQLLDHLSVTEQSYNAEAYRMQSYDDEMARTARARIAGDST